MSELPARDTPFEVVCPHCKKTFTAVLIAGATERHRGGTASSSYRPTAPERPEPDQAQSNQLTVLSGHFTSPYALESARAARCGALCGKKVTLSARRTRPRKRGEPRPFGTWRGTVPSGPAPPGVAGDPSFKG